jgi:hypothetical protein
MAGVKGKTSAIFEVVQEVGGAAAPQAPAELQTSGVLSEEMDSQTK